MSSLDILKRLFKDYTKKFRHKILLSIFFTLLVAASTSSIAWLLDPAIKKLFVEKNQTLLEAMGLSFVLSTFLSNSLSEISFTIHPAERIKTDPKKNKIR